MSHWIRNDEVTQEMRSDPTCPADACAFDKDDLRAFVLYTDCEILPGPRWHMVLAGSQRRPHWEEGVAALQQLLPGVESIALLPPPQAEPLAIHICELISQAERPRPLRPWRMIQ